MDTQPFRIVALTPAGEVAPELVIAADRAGCLGIVNAEIGPVPKAALRALAGRTRQSFGLKLPALDQSSLDVVAELAATGLGWLVLDAAFVLAAPEMMVRLGELGIRVVVEITEWDDRLVDFSGPAALLVKGHEAGGRVGEETSFILLQKALRRQRLPVWVRGGIGMHSAAAVRAVGGAAVVLDDQLLLLRESPIAEMLQSQLANFTGLETGLVAAGGDNWRIFEKPGFRHVRQLKGKLATMPAAAALDELVDNFGWRDPDRQILPLGQAAAFAAAFAERYATFGRLAHAMLDESGRRLERTAALDPLGAGQGVAAAHATTFPIVQGPMTRVSDVAGFAQAVAEAGALPMLALALMRPEQVDALLAETTARLAGKPWGVGLLGFAPAELIHAQIEIARKYAPRFALIAGGRPDQAKSLEEEGVTSYLHVPSPRLLTLFLEQGARRFVFEGRECGGHVGPLSSFVLWDTMVSTLLSTVRDAAQAAEIQVLFAGGVHDALSAAMVATIAAPLAERGVKVGVLAGTAYLFTREIVDQRAVVPGFQRAALGCSTTVTLETGPGHASRAAQSSFAEDFFARRRELETAGRSGDEIREELEALSLGRLRVASKGQERNGPDGRLRNVPSARQAAEGMYMLGQVATLRNEVVSLAELHGEISEQSHLLLAERVRRERREPVARASRPADIAIIGIGALLPGAQDVAEFWENVLDRHNAITEIPRHRWDWRLYFDEDRSKPDKIYSRWGGFLDDLLFDPLRYGIPPRAIEALDPLQLMTLEVVRRCIADAGLEGIDGSRERMSIIIGASGGAGDVGAQYAVRSELPRFTGELDPAAADRLPKWTEDSFAGILLNVAAGRAANRFDMGGVNFTVDAACASSLAAVYQAVSELESGRSDLVITGGVDTVQGPFGYLCFSKTQALSPRGRCRTFDTSADGIVISEGLAMLALKRLADAERDGDRVYAVIKGVGGSSDGRAKSMTAPHPDGQIRALTRAYEMAGYSPATVGLFEAHGTGTVAGDTAELETVTRLLRQTGAAPHGHAIGSVKTLIGHTKATAGAAGLVKAVLALHYKVLPPHGDVDAPNQKLTEPSSPLFLLKEPRPWIGNGMHPRRSAVSAFGFGGTNFHVALEEYDAGAAEAPRSRWQKELLVWRGPDRATVAAAIRKTAEVIAAGASPELRDLAVTLARQAPSEGLTATLVVRRDDPLAECFLALAAAIETSGCKLPPGAAFSEKPLLRSGGKLAIIFPGQGSQYPEMLRDVAIAFPEMRAVLERADRVLADRMRDKGVEGGALSRAIFPAGAYDDAAQKAAGEALTRTDVAQPALGAVEAGLLRVLRSLDLAPEMAAGHSYGEFVALHAAGVLDLDELLLVSEARGRFMVEAAADGDLGTMAAVRAERAAVEAAIAGIPDVCVANHNTPSQSVLSGTKKAVEEAIAALSAAGMTCQQLSVGAAFHSHIVAPARDRLAAFIAELPMRPAAMPVFGNASAAAYPADPDGMRALLAEQLGRPVEFVREIEQMHDAGARVFLSVGPKGAHASMVRQILGDRPHRAVACDDCEGGLGGLLAALGALLAEGAALNFERLWAGRDCRVLNVDLAGADRRPEPQPHMWYLNGGGAYRAGGSPRKPLMIEDVASSRPTAPAKAVAKAPLSEPAFRPAVPVAAAPAMNGTARSFPKEVRQMDSDEDHFPASQGSARGPELIAVGDREATLAEFQLTMQRFLETQQNVMLAYLSAAAPSQRPSRVALEAPRQRLLAQRSSQITVMPPAQMPAPAAHVNGSAAVVEAAPAPVSARTNGAAAPPPVNGVAAESHAIAAPLKNGGNGAAPHAPATPKPPANGANGHGEFGKPALTSLLLGLVEERTGYPRDMLGMDQNLEADLGIDSIKRVEIVGALLKALPASAQSGAAGFGESLNGQKTLNGIIDLVYQQVASAAGEAAPRPFDLAGTDIAADAACARPPRFVMAAHQEEFPAGTVPETLPAGLYLLTDDATGVARALAGRIEQAGGTARILDPDVEPALSDQEVGLSPVGLIHLAPLGAKPLTGDNPSDWRSQAQRYESQPHQLLRKFAATLAESGRVLIAAGLGGRFGRGASASGGVSVQGGGPGLVKCLREEWPGVLAKAVDLDPTCSAEDNARHLFEELAVPGGRMEVGYPGGSRTVFRTEPAELDPALPPRDALSSGAVVLATGGARGITAEVLRLIARPGVTLILAGRSPLPGAEDARFGDVPAGMLRGELIKAARKDGAMPSPAAIERQLQALLRDREIRANLRDFAASGARIMYRPTDIADPVQAAALVAGIYDEFGRLDGVIHGAGILEDKLVVDKDAASWSRVVETKALSAFMLSRSVRPETLRFFIMFGSVAGRYGNSGQSDYAAANELLNRLAWHLRGEWPDTVKIAVLNWGPWAGTRHGPGMVSGETRRKFEAKQVTLVEPAGGAQACLDEIMRAPLQDVEVVLGGGPWESEEARRGRLPERASKAPDAKPASQCAPVWPLLHRAVSEPGARGGRRLVTTLSVDEDLYLDQHRLDDVAVLPAAAALELAAEAAATIWPGWVVSEVSNFRLLNGFKLDDGDSRALEINLLGSEHGDAAGFSASVELRSTGNGGRLHYRASVKLSDALPQEPAPGWVRGFAPSPAPLSARDAYREILSHGPCFQVVIRLIGLDDTGIIAEVEPVGPAAFLGRDAQDAGWLFDPSLIDAAAQLAWLWSCQRRGMVALPNRFGRVSRYSGAGPACRIVFAVEPGLPQFQVKADVVVLDALGRPVFSIEALESTADRSLDRVRGWAGEIRV